MYTSLEDRLMNNLQIADQLQVPRIGQRHQAGSDSLLTAKTFFKLKERFFSENWDKVRFWIFESAIV